MKKFIMSILILSISIAVFAQESEKIYLWPDKVPGETEAKQEPILSDNTSRNVIRLKSVTNPALVVFKPEAAKNNGVGIIVCPGGAYQILAIDLEGYEIAKWLNNLGYTAFVLQYRVPNKRAGALNDVQRAMRIVRSQADIWGLNPDKLGVLGFSAGGSLSARASTNYDIKTYEAVDEKDAISCKPNFSVLIYPAYLDLGKHRALTPELTIDKNTPPMFIFATADDRTYGNGALVMATALRDQKVPVELHMLPTGGHGYGLREGNIAGETWPSLAEIWLSKTIQTK
jgi:acetyl esterase/lipase